MPQVGEIFESFRASEFVLQIDGRVSPGVSKISGLSEGEVDTVEQANGGLNRVHKIAGSVLKFEPLTIERYVDGSPEDRRFQDWFKQTFSVTGPLSPGGSGVRKNGMVIKMHDGQPVMKFAFYQAWIKSSKFTDLEAGSNNLFKQTIVLEHEGLERVE
jgi:phage tail-like protein